MLKECISATANPSIAYSMFWGGRKPIVY